MKKILAMILVMMMSLSVFAGCSKEETTAETQDGKASASENKPVEISKDEEITLKFALWTDQLDDFERIYEAFSKEHPNIKIEMVEYPAKEYGTTLTINLAGDGGLDMYLIKSNEDFSDLAYKNLTEPLDRFIEADQLDVTAFGPLYDASKVNGAVQALPYRKSAWVLYYNKDLFDAAGVDYPSDDMTWDEYRELAKRMTSGSNEDKIWGTYVHSWVSAVVGPALQTGATVADEDLDVFGKALDLRLALQADGSTMPYEEQIATTAHYNAAFQKGNLAMHYMGEWHIGQLRTAEEEGTIDFDWDIVPVPHFEGVEPNTTWGNATNIAINAATDEAKKAAAWEFIKFTTSEEGQIIIAEGGTLPAAITDKVTEAYLNESDAKPANIAVILDQSVYPESPIVPDISYIVNTIYNEEFGLALIGEQSTEETIAMIKERIIDEVN